MTVIMKICAEVVNPAVASDDEKLDALQKLLNPVLIVRLVPQKSNINFSHFRLFVWSFWLINQKIVKTAKRDRALFNA
jgi:hypothetical protein